MSQARYNSNGKLMSLTECTVEDMMMLDTSWLYDEDEQKEEERDFMADMVERGKKYKKDLENGKKLDVPEPVARTAMMSLDTSWLSDKDEQKEEEENKKCDDEDRLIKENAERKLNDYFSKNPGQEEYQQAVDSNDYVTRHAFWKKADLSIIERLLLS